MAFTPPSPDDLISDSEPQTPTKPATSFTQPAPDDIIPGSGSNKIYQNFFDDPRSDTAVGTALKYAGGVAKGVVEDIVEAPSRLAGYTKGTVLENTAAADLGEKVHPYDERLKNSGAGGTAKFVSDVTTGIAEMLPSMVVAGGTAGFLNKGLKIAPWLAEAIGTGTIFGTDETGFHPIKAVEMGALPSVSKFSGDLMAKVLDKIGIRAANSVSENAFKALGGLVGSQAYFEALNTPTYLDPNISADDKRKMFLQGLATNIALHIHSIPGMIEEGKKKDAIEAAAKDEVKKFWAGVDGKKDSEEFFKHWFGEKSSVAPSKAPGGEAPPVGEETAGGAAPATPPDLTKTTREQDIARFNELQGQLEPDNMEQVMGEMEAIKNKYGGHKPGDAEAVPKSPEVVPPSTAAPEVPAAKVSKIVPIPDKPAESRTPVVNMGKYENEKDYWKIPLSGWMSFYSEGSPAAKDAPAVHRSIVEEAVKEGKPVPAEVLADYPDLKPAETPPVAPVEKPAAPEPQPAAKPENAPAAPQSGESSANFVTKLDFDGRVLTEDSESGNKPAYFDITNPDDPEQKASLIADATSKTSANRSNTHRVTFFTNQETGEVVGLATWKNAKGVVMVSSQGAKKTGTSYAKFTEDGNMVPVASVRLEDPINNNDPVIHFADEKEFEDKVTKPARAEIEARKRIAEKVETVETGNREDSAHGITKPVYDMGEDAGDAMIDLLPKGKDGKIPRNLSEEDVELAVINALTSGEMDDLALNAILDIKDHLESQPEFQKMSLVEQNDFLSRFIAKQTYEKYQSAGFTDSTPASRNEQAPVNAEAKAAEPVKAAEVPGPAVGSAAEPGGDAVNRSETTGGPVLQAEPDQATGGGRVLPGTEAANPAADSIKRVDVTGVTELPAGDDPLLDYHPIAFGIRALHLKRDQTVAETIGAISKKLGLKGVAKAVADILIKHAGDVNIHFVDGISAKSKDVEGSAHGFYDPQTHTITISTSAMDSSANFTRTVLHEAFHAASTYALVGDWKPDMGLTREEFTDRQFELHYDLSKIIKQLRVEADLAGIEWPGLRNERELLAEAMTDKDFQEWLDKTEVTGRGDPEPITGWKKIISAFGKFFGMKNDSALAHIVSLAGEAVKLNKQGRAAGDTGVEPILIENEKAARERRINEGEMRPEERDELIASEQAQNHWVNIPIIEKLPEYIKDRLPFLKQRENVYTNSVEKNGQRGWTFEGIENSDLPVETKAKLHKDVLDNMLDAENKLERARVNNEQDIENASKKMADTLGDSRILSPERYATESVEGIISNAQSKLARDLKNGADPEIIKARIADLNSVVEEGSTVFNQFFSELANATPDAVLDDPKANTADIIAAVAPVRDGYGRVTFGKLTTTEPNLLGVMDAFSADTNLAERLKAFKMLTDPANRPEMEKAVTEMRDAVVKNILDKYLSENGDVARSLQFISKDLRSAMNLRDKAQKTIAAISQIAKDKDWRDLRYQTYKKNGQFAPFFNYSVDQDAVKLTNPITGKEVQVRYSLDGLSSKENRDKLIELADAARQYVFNKDAAGYDPNTALGWEKFLENADFWLNPNWNPAIPRKVPTRWSFLGWLSDLKSDANKLMETLTGIPFNDVQVSLNALSDFREEAAKLEAHYGYRIDKANRDAAKLHGMTVDQWREEIANRINAYSQFTGQVPFRAGDLMRGRVITAEDIAAIKLSKEYEDTLRKKGEAQEGIGGAKKINPNRVQTQQGFRLSGPSSPFENTRPGKFDYDKAKAFWQEWSAIEPKPDGEGGLDAARREWLSKPENLKLLLDHIEWNQTPDYAGKSQFRATYREIAKEMNAGKDFTFDEIVDRVFDDLIADENKDIVPEKDDVAKAIIGEITGLFKRVESRVSEEDLEKAGDRVSVHSSKNSFTRARADETQFPPSMMEWGAVTYPERVSLMHNALAPYVTEVIGKQGTLDRAGIALDKLAKKYQDRLKAATDQGKSLSQAKKEIASDVALGQEFYDYAQLQTVIKRFDRLRKSTIATEENQNSDPELRKWYHRVSRTYLAQVLSSAGARLRHTFGNFVTTALFFERMDGVLGGAGELAKRTGRQVANVIPTIVADLKQTWRPADLENMGVANGWFAEKVLERQRDIARLVDKGFIDPANLREKIQNFQQACQDVFKDVDKTKALTQRIGKAGDATLEAFNSFFTNAPVFSARFNDMLLHLDAKNTALDFERRLQANALESFDAREQGNPNGYRDLDNPANRLSPQELIGRKLVNERNAVEWRKFFEVMGMDLDKRMLDYYERVKQAREQGQDVSSVPMFDEGQKSAIEWNILQQTGKSSYLNRPFLAKGGLQSQSQWLLYGIPLWSLGRLEGTFARMNYQTKGRYAWQILPTAIAVTAVMAATGAAFDEAYRMAKKFFYGEQSSNPGALNARNAKDVFHLAIRGWSAFMPIIGDMVNNALNTTGKFGNPDSMFLVWNILSDTMKSMTKVYQTHDPVGPLLDYARRWSPAAHVALAATGYHAGLTNLYSAANMISAATPDTIPVRKRTAGAGSSATPVTPVIQDMISAALTGKTDQATQYLNTAVADKVAEGMTDAQAKTAIASSYAARNPWILTLGRLPTEQEREVILSRMSDDQRAQLLATEQAFTAFGQQIGSNVHFTQEQGQAGAASASVGLSRGSGSVLTGGRSTGGGESSGAGRVGGGRIGGGEASIAGAGPVGGSSAGPGPRSSRIGRGGARASRISGRKASVGRSRISGGGRKVRLSAPKHFRVSSGRSHHRLA